MLYSRCIMMSGQMKCCWLLFAVCLPLSLNREAALQNVQRLCPALFSVPGDSYQTAAHKLLLIEIKSCEVATSGKPLSMACYAVSTLPIITRLQAQHTSIRQSWYADDSVRVGRLRLIQLWWDELQTIGQRCGYFINSETTQLFVKPELEDAANKVFADAGLGVVMRSGRYLG